MRSAPGPPGDDVVNPITADSTAPAPASAPKSTTAKTLWVLCAALLIATTVTFGTSLWVFRNVHGTVETVRTNTAPAILDVLAAEEALVRADSAAISSFQSGEVKISGPGLQHQNQLTVASQNLAQVAEHNSAGPQGSQRIQLLEGLLESYSGSIGQAHAHFGTAVGTADLWSASRLLHNGDNSILAELDHLREDQDKALIDQIKTSSMISGNLLVWAVPIAFLFVLLGVTQVFLKRRFRRSVNPLLLLSTLVVVGLSMVTSLALVSQHRLESTRDTLGRVTGEWKADISAADAQGQWTLGRLVMIECSQEKGGCGPTVNRSVTDRVPTDGTADRAHDTRVVRWNRDVDEQTGPAARNSHLWFFIPLMSALIAVLIPFGLWPRIEEYRYRPR
jgi:hypothetical protein